MNPALSTVLATCFVAQLSAQAITVTASIPSPATMTATSATVVDTDITTLAPPTGGSSVNATDVTSPSSGVVLGSIGWAQMGDANRELTYRYRMNALFNAPTGTVTFDEHEVLIEISAPTPRRVDLEIARHLQLPVGVPAPRLDVDLGDDGTIDSSQARNVLVGPTPYRIRLICSLDVDAPGAFANVLGALDLTIRPDNGLDIEHVVAACTFADFDVFEPFDSDGVALRVRYETAPVFVVLGFDAQPVVVPVLSVIKPLPCVLYPTPDVIAFFPSGENAGLSISLPPAVRPATFYAQCVTFFGPDYLYPTDGFRVSAF